MSSQRKAKERLEAKVIEKRKKEQAEMRSRPDILENSRKLVQSRQRAPIYSATRMQQIAAAKHLRLDRLRQEVETKRRFEFEKELSSTTPSFARSLDSDTLCFDPKSVRSQVYDFHPLPREEGETSEEIEVRKCCSFCPSTDKKSRRMFARQNVRNKPVVSRLLDYGKMQRQANQKRVAESVPSFVPTTNSNNKTHNISEPSEKPAITRKKEKSLLMVQMRRDKQRLTLESQEKEVPGPESVTGVGRAEEGGPRAEQKPHLTVEELKRLMGSGSRIPSEGSIKASSSAKSSVLAKYAI